MSRLGMSLLVVALVSLANATLVGQYSVRNAYRLRGGNPVIGRPYSLSDQSSAASYSVQYPQDIYFQAEQCAQGSSCTGASIATCCSSCTNGHPTPGAKNPTDCFCASYNDSKCLDTKTTVSAHLAQGSNYYFEFGLIAKPCQNIIVTVESMSGDQDLSLSDEDRVTPDFSGFYWESYLYLSDALIMCSHADDGDGDYQNGISMYDGSTLRKHLYGTLNGWVGGNFILTVKEATNDHPFFLLSPRSHYFLAPDLKQVTCDVQIDSLVRGVPPSMDPGFERYAALGGAVSVAPKNLPANVYSFSFYLWYVDSGILSTYYESDPASCVMNATHFRNSKGQLLPSEIVTFEPQPLVCHYKSLVEALDGFRDTVNALQTTDSYAELGVALAVGSTIDSSSSIIPGVLCAWAIQNSWLGCLKLLSTNLTSSNITSISIPSVTVCTSAFGSIDYAIDPCCNISLLFTQCCAPRSVIGSKVSAAVNEDFLMSECKTPICSRQVANDYLSIAALGSDFEAGCDAATSPFRTDAALTNDVFTNCVAYVYSNLPCDNATPCLYGLTCRNNGYCSEPLVDDPLIMCILTSLYPSFDLQFREIVNLTATSPMTQFVGAIKQYYTVTGCNQPYYTFFNNIGDDYFFRDMSLDFDKGACLEANAFCNWDWYTYTEEECLNPPEWATPNFCGSCYYYNLPRCSEVSYWPGCYLSYTGSNSVNEERCILAGGEYDSDYELLFQDCYLPTLSEDFDTCLPVVECPYYYYNDTTWMYHCDEYCLFEDIADPIDCTCAGVGADSDLCATYGGMAWRDGDVDSSAVIGCQFATYPDIETIADDCATLGGRYWHGSRWQDPYLGNTTTCGAAGTCSAPEYDDPTLCVNTEACGLCSFDTDCNNQYSTPEACALGGSCTNLFYSTGSCVFPFSVDSLSGRPYCDSYLILDPLGCVDVYYSDSIECTADGGKWLTESLTSSDCTSYKGCNETTFAPFNVLTQKSPSACTACGGATANIFSWQPGTWQPQRWSGYSWLGRQWIRGNSWGPVWNRSAFQADLDRMYYRQQAQIARADLLCRSSRIANALQNIGCDCSGGSHCYETPTPSFVGLSQACTLQQLNFTPSDSTDKSGVPPLRLFVSPDVQFSFKQPTVSIYSNLFLSSIRDDPYAVVENNHGISVGQLQGDIIHLELGDGVDSSRVDVGNMTLCLLLKPPPSKVARFTQWDFAIANAKYKPDSFRSQELNATVHMWGNFSYLCAQIYLEGNYAPVLRTPHPRSMRYKDTLSKTQYNAFIVAATIYSIILVLTLWRVFNLFLFTHWQKGDVVARAVLLLPKTVLSVLAVFLFLRILLFAFVPSGVLHAAPVVINLLLAEVPTGLYFSLFTLMVIWWMELYHRSTNLQKGFLGQSRTAFFVINVVVYLFLLILIIIFAVKSRDASVKECAAAPDKVDKTPQIVAKVYKVFISVLSFFIAVGFIIYGLRLIALLGAMNHDVRSSLVKFTVVSITCSLGLLMECALLLYGAFGANNVSTIVALVLLIIVEIVPAIALIATMRQPPNPSAPEGCMGDTFWFCFAEKSYFAMTDNSGKTSSSRRPESERRASSAAARNPVDRLGSAQFDQLERKDSSKRDSSAEDRLGTAFLGDDDEEQP